MLHELLQLLDLGLELLAALLQLLKHTTSCCGCQLLILWQACRWCLAGEGCG